MMTGQKKLVMGASGFLGSHITRQLVQRGDDVRVFIRRTSSTKAFDDLDVERHYGDIFDEQAVRAAMDGCDVVFYCIVDTRFSLRDPAPLFRTNVEGLRHVLDVASQANLRRFVFTSTIGTIAMGNGGLVTEDEPFNWHDRCGSYIESRLAAEDLVLRYSRERGLPAVVMCVSNTFGPLDWGPSQHGLLVAAPAAGRAPVYVNDVAMEVVGIEDAANAFLLAADSGRVGERYIISERFMSLREIFEVAASATGARTPRFGIPLKAVYAMVFAIQTASKVLRRDPPMTVTGIRLMHAMSPMDHGKAVRELNWKPEPTADSIRKAALFYQRRKRA